jgi:hypothetical protein
MGNFESSQEQISADTERMLLHTCKGVNAARRFA